MKKLVEVNRVKKYNDTFASHIANFFRLDFKLAGDFWISETVMAGNKEEYARLPMVV
ncbi:MAG: hypothetical protein HY579_10315 [Nitrospinae bacterium]|nr:hypothetical protein [Nitrospinota bacterium]